MTERTIRVQLVGDASSLIAAAQQGTKALTDLGNVKISGVAGGMNEAGEAADKASGKTSGWAQALQTGLGVVGVQTGFQAIASGFQAVISNGLDFEKSMNMLKAVTGASGEKMKEVSALAKKLGTDISIPGVSAGDAALAMQELAKGGLTVDQAMTAAKGTLQLATAAQIDGATAAQIQANALNAFGLSAGDAQHVADLLANSANASSGEITDMASALAQSATVAHSFGISVDDSSTTLSLFAKNGLIGSDAGTSFKSMLSAMASPTKQQRDALDELNVTVFDSQGKFVGMKSITEQLSTAKKSMSDQDYLSAASTAFGTDAIRAANIMASEGVTGYDNMATAVGKAGGAQDLAAAQTEGLVGALGNFTNAATGAGQNLYDMLQPAMAAIVEEGGKLIGWVGDAIGWFGQLPEPVQNIGMALGAVLLLRGPLTAMWTSIKLQAVTAFQILKAQAIGAGVALRGFELTAISVAAAAKGLLAALGGPIGIAIVAVTTALSFLGAGSDDAAASTEGLAAAVDSSTGAFRTNAAEIAAHEAAQSGALEKYKALGGNTTDYVNALMLVPGAQDKVNDVLNTYKVNALAAGGAGSTLIQQGSLYKDVADTYSASITTVTTAQTEGKLAAEAAAGAQKAAADAAARAAGELQPLTQAQADLNTELAKGIDPSTAMKDALKLIGEEANDADTAGQFLWATLEKLAGGLLTAEQSARLQAAAIREIGSSARDTADAHQKVIDAQSHLDEVAAHLGTTLDGQDVSASNLAITQADVDKATRDLANAKDSEAGATDKQAEANQRAAQAGLDAAGAAYTNAAALGGVAAGSEAARAATQSARDEFIKAHTDLGMDADAAGLLADKYHLIPGQVVTELVANGVDAALKHAQDLNAELAKLNNKSIYYTVVGSSTVQYTAAAAGGASSTDAYRLQTLYGGSAEGGWISGPGGPKTDSVIGRLSTGEFVVNAGSAGRNRALLEAINNGTMGFADGGEVPASTTMTGAVVGTVSAPEPDVIKVAWDAIAAAVADAWTAVIQPTLQAQTDASLAQGVTQQALLNDYVTPSWSAIGTTVQTTVGTVINPTFDALNAATNQVGATAIALRDASVNPAWQGMSDQISAVWNLVGGAIFPAYTASMGALGASGQALAANTQTSWAQIGASISDTYNLQIVPAWNGVQSFANATGSFFAGIASGTATARASTTSDIAEITTAIDEFFTNVNGMAGVTTTTTTSGGLPALADGGLITQGTGPRADDVHIRASKGEYVVNAAATSRHRDTLDRINYGYADGGVIGDTIGTKVKDGIVTATQRAIEVAVTKALASFATSTGGFASNGNWGPINLSGFAENAAAAKAYIEANFGGVSSIGGLYGGSVPGSDHPFGKALDVMIADYRSPGGIASGDAIAEWFYQNANAFGTKYEIWRDRFRNAGGQWQSYQHPSGSDDTLQHRDHVHLSFLTGAAGFTGQPTVPADDVPTDGSWLARVLAKINGTATFRPTVGSTGSGGVEQWRALALQALAATGQSPTWITAMLAQMDTESSGNPNAIQTTDINAQRGDPSKGLLQVIGTTFRDTLTRHGLASLIPAGQYDPWANMISAIYYTVDKFGSLAKWNAAIGGNPNPYDNGGMLPVGWSQTYNGTGSPEAVMNDRQWSIASRAMNYVISGGGGASVKPPVVTVYNYLDGTQIDARTVVLIDDGFKTFAGEVNRQRVQAT